MEKCGHMESLGDSSRELFHFLEVPIQELEFGSSQNWYFEDHPGTCKELGSPPNRSHKFRPWMEGVSWGRSKDHHGTINH